MGYIAEPLDVDLVIAGGKLTAEDRKLLRAMITKQKAKSKARPVRVRAVSSGAKRARKTSRPKAKA
jgi:hydroxyethylthiazole kinase-like sugar kinase family protein